MAVTSYIFLIFWTCVTVTLTILNIHNYNYIIYLENNINNITETLNLSFFDHLNELRDHPMDPEFIEIQNDIKNIKGELKKNEKFSKDYLNDVKELENTLESLEEKTEKRFNRIENITSPLEKAVSVQDIDIKNIKGELKKNEKFSKDYLNDVNELEDKIESLEEKTEKRLNKIENITSPLEKAVSVQDIDIKNIKGELKKNEKFSKDYLNDVNELEDKIQSLEEKTEKRYKRIENITSPLEKAVCVQDIECPKGSTRIGSECFQWFPIWKSWQETYNYCKEKGGFLPELNNLDFDMMDLLAKMPLFRKMVLADTREGIAIWLDAKDEKEEGKFIWGSGIPLYTNDTRWAPNQPSLNKENQDCLTISFDKSNGNNDITAGFNDNPCSYTYDIICEMHPINTYYAQIPCN